MAYPGSQTKITLTHDKETTADLKMGFITQVLSKEMQISRLELLLNEIGMGNRNGTIALTIDDGNPVAAVGSLTFTNISTANDTFLINGVTMTAVASAATPQQWNVGASATAQAANFVTAVAAANNALISGHVTAVAATSIVTFSAAISGLAGNAVTIAKGVDSATVMTASGGRLAGGTAATNSNAASTYSHGV